jgi:hypothetical protein
MMVVLVVAEMGGRASVLDGQPLAERQEDRGRSVGGVDAGGQRLSASELRDATLLLRCRPLHALSSFLAFLRVLPIPRFPASRPLSIG